MVCEDEMTLLHLTVAIAEIEELRELIWTTATAPGPRSLLLNPNTDLEEEHSPGNGSNLAN